MAHTMDDSETPPAPTLPTVTHTDSAPSTPSVQLSVPSVGIPHLRLGERISGGFSSEILAGRNKLAAKACAVKLIRPELEVGHVTRGRYAHACRLASYVQHAGIVDVFRVDTAPNGQTFAVCELIKGVSLRALIRKTGPLSRRAYVPIIRELCAALAAAHERHLWHLRLHPGNVMVNWKGDDAAQLRVLDFGVHHLHPPIDEEKPGLQRNSEYAACIAPEQINGSLEDVDQRTDVYALACMLYHMVCGQSPFVGDTFAATCEMHVNETPRPPSEIVPVTNELEQAIFRGLAKDPKGRTPSVSALLSELDPLASTTGVHKALAKRKSRSRSFGSASYPALPLSAMPSAELELSHAGIRPGHRKLLLFGGIALATLGMLGVLWWSIRPSDPIESNSGSNPSKRRAVSENTQSVSARTAPDKRTSSPSIRRKGTPEPQKTAPLGTRAAFLRDKGRPQRGERLTLKRSAMSNSKSSRRRQPGRKRVSKATKTSFGDIRVTTPSASARIFLDGVPSGRGRQHVFQRTHVGEHTIQVEINGTKGLRRKVLVLPNREIAVRFDAPDPKPADTKPTEKQ